jgi:hypothetical protein
MKCISLGGLCGAATALNENCMSYAWSLPFNYVGSTFPGIIDCIENDFTNFFPKKLIAEHDQYCPKFFRGKYFTFMHHDLLDDAVIESFKRKIQRFKNALENESKLVFLRVTTTTESYYDEIKLTGSFINAINKKYPKLEPILIYIVPDQDDTRFVLTIEQNVHLFTLNRSDEYKIIIDCIKNEDLFTNKMVSTNFHIDKIINRHLIMKPMEGN